MALPRRVEVRLHRRLAADLAAWVVAGTGRPEDRRALLQFYLDGVVSELERHRGEPPGVVRVPGVHPPVFDWHYSADVWVRFAVRDVRRWFRPAVRKVTVYRFVTQPPGLEVP
jgi:hypothetical protein